MLDYIFTIAITLGGHYSNKRCDMTLRGKRKALNNSPEAQIAAIAGAFGGKVPVKPLHRRYPQAAWQEGDTYHIAKLTRKGLYLLN